MIGWIKLNRSLIDWEWYDDDNTVRLLIHLLLTVNYEDKKWKGLDIKAGSRITSWDTLTGELKSSSKQQVRTAMTKLETSGEVTRKSTNRFQLISLVKWDKFQDFEKEDNRQNLTQTTDKQQTDNRQITPTKEVNNINNKTIKEKYSTSQKFNFKKSLIEIGVQEKFISEWLLVRKNRKSTNTETAFKSIVREIEKTNLTANEVIKKCVEKSWGGFNSSWLQENNNSNAPKKGYHAIVKNR